MGEPLTTEELEALAAQRRTAQAEEYGQFVAAQDIQHDGALAYLKGQQVPVSNVRRLGYFVNGLVVTAEQAAAEQAAAASEQDAAEAELAAAHDAAMAAATKPEPTRKTSTTEKTKD